MSMIEGCVLGTFTVCALFFGACGGQSDYQGGGRRTDLGRGPDSAIALNSGDENTGGSAGSSGAATVGGAGRAGHAGYAGCAASGDGGQVSFGDCTQ